MGFDWSAVDDGDVEIYKQLKALVVASGHKEDLDAGYSPLYAAIHFGKSGELKKLLEEVPDIDVNKVEPNFSKPILFAVEANSLEALKELIGKGAEFENVGMLSSKRVGEEGVVMPIPLLAACCYCNRPEMADFLLRNCKDRIDINQTHTNENRTALYAAVSCGHLGVAEVLLRHGADAAIASNVLGTSVLPIEKAIMRGDARMAAALHSRNPELTYERRATSDYSPIELTLAAKKDYLADYLQKSELASLAPVGRPEDVTLAELEKEFSDFEAVAREGRGVISDAVAKRVSGASLDMKSSIVRM